jgi:hypothetical protein
MMAANGMNGVSQRTFDLSGVTTQGRTECTLKFIPTKINKNNENGDERK